MARVRCSQPTALGQHLPGERDKVINKSDVMGHTLFLIELWMCFLSYGYQQILLWQEVEWHLLEALILRQYHRYFYSAWQPRADTTSKHYYNSKLKNQNYLNSTFKYLRANLFCQFDYILIQLKPKPLAILVRNFCHQIIGTWKADPKPRWPFLW